MDIATTMTSLAAAAVKRIGSRRKVAQQVFGLAGREGGREGPLRSEIRMEKQCSAGRAR